MLKVVALLCAAMIPRSECTSQNAIDVLQMADAANELVCMRDSMTTLASLAIRARPDEYWKVICVAPDAAGPVLVGESDDRRTGEASSVGAADVTHQPAAKVVARARSTRGGRAP